MKNNCSPQTFMSGLKAIGGKFNIKQSLKFLGMVVVMFFGLVLFFSCLHALITLMGLVRIYLFNLPIDTSTASFWISASDDFRDHVFWAGYDVFRWLVVIGTVGMLLFFVCSAICEMGRPEAKDDVAASEVSSD